MSHHPPAARGAVLAAALLLSIAGAASATPVERGVVADEAREQVLVMEVEGGIAAIDAATGKTRWSSAAADLPLFVQGGRIAALRDVSERGVLAYAVLDAEDGSVIESRFATLPVPARVLVDERLGERFEVKPLPGNRVAWTYTSETVPGAFIKESVLPEAGGPREAAGPGETRIVLSGVVTIDVGEGRASVAIDATERASMPHAAVDTREMPELGGQRFLSSAATHLVATERAGGENYRWRVHARGGARVGEVVTPYAYLPFAVLGRTLVVTTPLRLDRRGNAVEVAPVAVEALDLASGTSRWRHPIRDTAYRGPFPH